MASETNAVVDPSGPTSKGFRQGFVSPGPWPNAADPTDSPAAVTPLKPYPAPANPQGISGTYPSNAPTDTPANARPTPEDLLNQARREVDALSAHESWLENPIGSSPQLVRTRIDLPRSKRFSHTVLGTTLVLGGLFAIAVRSDWITVGSGIDNLLAFALIGVGAVLFFGAWYGRPFGFLNVGAVLFALLAAASFVGAKWGDGVGQRTYQPKSLRDLQSEYRLGAGTLSLDLSRVNFAGQTRVIDANIGAGAIAIEVPAATSVVVNSITKGGEITLFGETNSQSRRQFRFGNAPSDAKPQLTLNVRAGVGAIEVAQAGKLLKLTDLKSGSLSFNYGSDDGVRSNQVDRNNDTNAVDAVDAADAIDARQTNPSVPRAKAIGSLTATRGGTVMA